MYHVVNLSPSLSCSRPHACIHPYEHSQRPAFWRLGQPFVEVRPRFEGLLLKDGGCVVLPADAATPEQCGLVKAGPVRSCW